MSCGSVLMRLILSRFLLLVLSVIILNNDFATAKPRNDYRNELSGDFKNFVNDMSNIIYTRKEENMFHDVPNRFNVKPKRFTTPRNRLDKRYNDKISTQKDALRDVLMMKLVSYYEEKYKLDNDNNEDKLKLSSHVDGKFCTSHDEEKNRISKAAEHKTKYFRDPLAADIPLFDANYKNTHDNNENVNMIYNNRDNYRITANNHRITKDEGKKNTEDHRNENKLKYAVSGQYNRVANYMNNEDNYRISENGNKYGISSNIQNKYRIYDDDKNRRYRLSHDIRDTFSGGAMRMPKNKPEIVTSDLNLIRQQGQHRIMKEITPDLTVEEGKRFAEVIVF